VMGWVNHGWQQRAALGPLLRRIADIETLYRTDNAALARDLLDRYDIEYVVVGSYERNRYGIDAGATLARIGRLVFDNGTFAVYAVRPAPPDPPATR
jgi:uncharacterized membrane protein